MEDTQTLKLGKKLTLSFASASQRGYYHSDREKANQDTVLSGLKVHKRKLSYNSCSQITKEVVASEFTAGFSTRNKSNSHRQEKDAIEGVLENAYLAVNAKLKICDFNADSSGTTAVSLCASAKSNLYVANVGDSRCITISKTGGSLKVNVLTNDHSPDREDEKAGASSWHLISTMSWIPRCPVMTQRACGPRKGSGPEQLSVDQLEIS